MDGDTVAFIKGIVMFIALGELDERVDFVERRLVQDLERPRLPAPTRIPTPV